MKCIHLLLTWFMGCFYSLSANEIEAIQKAINLVSNSAKTYTEKRDCISCHHQSLPVMALARSKAAGYLVSEESISEQTRYIQEYFHRRLKRIQDGNGVIGGPYTAGYALAQMAAAKEEKEETIEALITYLLKTQNNDGSWRIRTHRPPLEDSDFTATALAVLGLQHYSQNHQKATRSAIKWLKGTKTHSTEDRVFQILGLHWAGEDTSNFAEVLVHHQQEDFGWAQLPDMESDAYATGQVLFALQESGHSQLFNQKLVDGRNWLIENQKQDGSWFVKSRSRPIQKYFESGFPHGKDQFISISATCWAIMALSYNCD